jgi:hypothetical protein
MSTSTACDSLKIPCNEKTQPLTSPAFFSHFFTLICTALFITTWVFQINSGFQQISMSNREKKMSIEGLGLWQEKTTNSKDEWREEWPTS